MVELNGKSLEAAEVAWRGSVSATCKLMLRDAIRAYLSTLPAHDGLVERLILFADHLFPAVLEYGREIAMIREAATALQSQAEELQHLRADAHNPDKGMWTFWNEKARAQAEQIERLTRERDEWEAKWIAADEGEKLNAEFLAHSDARAEAAEQQVQKLTAENERLREAVEASATALDEAAIDVQSWGAYASEYFQDKHDLDGCCDAIVKQAGAARSAIRQLGETPHAARE